jgi:Flp pilus assembly protein TadD
MILCFFIAMLVSGTSTARVSAMGQDIDGAATKIFGRPADPEVHRQATMEGATQRSNRNGKATATTDGVDDALELGNAARNAKPPRYHDAELAYRLAAKLDPQDPRPVMGLANIWYDQKQFEAAAKMYREAFMRMSAATGGSLRSQITTAEQRRRLSEAHGYAGVAFLQNEKYAEAQIEFEKAVSAEGTTARWHALKGYSLLKRGKTELAAKALQEALRLDPANEDYQALLAAAQK